MLHVWIHETLHNGISEGFQLRPWKVQRLKQFAIHHLADIFSDFRIFKALPDCIKTRKIAHRREHGMRSVEQGHLSFMIRGLARNKEHIQTGLVGREFLCNRLRSLYYPEMEYLALHYKIVLESYAFMDLVDGILRVSRHDAVNERAINATCLLEPCLESFFKVPELDILMNAFFQMLAIEEDKFAWKDYQTFGCISVEMSVSMVK